MADSNELFDTSKVFSLSGEQCKGKVVKVFKVPEHKGVLLRVKRMTVDEVCDNLIYKGDKPRRIK